MPLTESLALSAPDPSSPDKSTPRQVLPLLVSLLLSVLVHGAAAAPYIAWAMSEPPDVPGEQDGGDTVSVEGGEPSSAEPIKAPPAPVNISMYVEPVAAPVEAPTPAPQSTPSTSRPSSSTPSQSSGSPSSGSGSGGSSGSGNNTKTVSAPRGNNCEPSDQVTKVKSHHWQVDRDLVDYYASHLRELDRQASVSTHRGEDGKADGLIIYLPRCSIIRQGGIRNGDIIRTVNGRKVTNVANAVTTWLAVRKSRNIEVVITRKSGKTVTQHYRLK